MLYGSRRGPSGHSATSRTSSSVSRSSSRRDRVERPRYHQPTGYRSSFGGDAKRYYGRRHDYIFFPVAWTDPDTGASYESGYYDENGVRYNNIALEQNGQYENVVCRCDYCGNESILTISASEPSDKSLACPVCGGAMEIRSALDDYLDEGAAGYSSGMDTVQTQKRRSPVLIFGLIIAVVAFIAVTGLFAIRGVLSSAGGSSAASTDAGGTYGNNTEDIVNVFDEDTIYLAQTGNNVFTVSDTGADKTLVWDADAESYYDADTECWLWYNTDVEPALWQYWYEGISSEYGDYGWMEHYDDGWFIEEDYGEWVPLPDHYDTGELWYIE